MTNDYKEQLRVDESHPDVDLVYITPKIVVLSDKNDADQVCDILLENHPSNTYMIFDLTEQQTGISLLHCSSRHFTLLTWPPTQI